MGDRSLRLRTFLACGLLVLPGHAVAEASESQATSAEPLITNTFFETDLRQALVDMSSQAGIPLIPDQSVQGTVSVELKGVPLEKALQMVLAGGGFTFRKMDGYYFIGQAVPQNPSFNLLTVTEQLKLNYIRAKEALELVPEAFKSFIQISEETNALTVTASPEVLERIKRDLRQVDRPPKQVMIEALVTELSDEAKHNLGVDWTWDWANQDTTAQLKLADLALDLAFTSTPAHLTRQVLAKINALAQQGKASVRANPRIMTIEGQEASITIATDEFFLVNVGSVAFPSQTLQKVQAGIVLKLTPFVTEQRDITMKLEPEVSDVTSRSQAQGQPIITIGRRTASTTIRVKDGETIVIGGLVQERTSDSLKKVPLLGDIPLAGKMFQKTEKSTKRNEVVIFITPHLLDAVQQTTQQSIVMPVIYVNPTETFTMGPSLELTSPLEAYRSAVRQKIFSAIRRLSPTPSSGSVSVTFTVAANGRLIGEPMAESQHGLTLEQIAKLAVKRAAPFDPFPVDEKRSEQTFRVTLIFEP